MKTLFKNGMIVDGTGGKPYIGDVLIEDDRILEVGGERSAEADRIVDLTGCQICPGLIGSITSAFSSLTESAENLTDRAAEILNRFIETLAVMIVTSCVIPILVLLFFLWIVKLVTGVEISPPTIPHRHMKIRP